MGITIKNGDEIGTKIISYLEEGQYGNTYTRNFDKENPMWTHDRDMNIAFIGVQQAYANAVLESKGYLFLNDVYDMLGFPRTKDGQIVGWSYTKNRTVRFRMLPTMYNKSDVVISFTVDGCILQYI